MIFVAKMGKYGIFVAKFCKYALIFQGYAAVIDSSANCAALLWGSNWMFTLREQFNFSLWGNNWMFTLRESLWNTANVTRPAWRLGRRRSLWRGRWLLSYLVHYFLFIICCEFTFKLMGKIVLDHYLLWIHIQVSGDFIVEECEVDGNPASQMKRILVRQ